MSAPYSKHNKAPYRYSELYQRWHSAVLSGKQAEARKLGAEHSRHWLSQRIVSAEAAAMADDPSLMAAE